MNSKQINTTIAERCGITTEDQRGLLYHTVAGYARDCPDYLNDLNAMNEAEMTLPIWLDGEEYQGTRHHFRHELCLICDQPIHATAAQRAEAFRRVIGK